jgi:LemA protein
MVPFVAVLVLAGLAALWFVGLYNGLVRLRNEVRNAWSQIDVQLKRRHDLIPNLVETVKGYAAHERNTLDEVVRARGAAVAARGVEATARAEQELSGALGRLMAVVERYPDLKANQNFLALQEELTSTENKIGFSRQAYNDAVMTYDTKVESFPANLVAGPFGFVKEAFFEIAEATERQPPQVRF